MKATYLVSVSFMASMATAATTVHLGSETFEAPDCGPFDPTVVTADCDAAVNALLAAHCTEGICSIPSPGVIAFSGISAVSGSCEVLVSANVGGDAATFKASQNCPNEGQPLLTYSKGGSRTSGIPQFHQLLQSGISK
jgi:hypothetical protein